MKPDTMNREAET
jgi:hypothetical protein